MSHNLDKRSLGKTPEKKLNYDNILNIIVIMRIFKALSHTKTLPVGRFNFDKSGSINVPTLVIKINTPASVEVNRYNESKINNKTPKIDFDDLSTKELQQLLDFVV